MIARTEEVITLKKHISCKYKCKFDGSKCNSYQNWNNDNFQWDCKNSRKNVCKKRLYLESC